MNIAELRYQGELVGYRFTIGSKNYDVEIGTVHALGVSLSGISQSIELKARGSLLVSDEEIARRKRIKDLTNQPEKMKAILDSLVKRK